MNTLQDLIFHCDDESSVLESSQERLTGQFEVRTFESFQKLNLKIIEAIFIERRSIYAMLMDNCLGASLNSGIDIIPRMAKLSERMQNCGKEVFPFIIVSADWGRTTEMVCSRSPHFAGNIQKVDRSLPSDIRNQVIRLTEKWKEKRLQSGKLRSNSPMTR